MPGWKGPKLAAGPSVSESVAGTLPPTPPGVLVSSAPQVLRSSRMSSVSSVALPPVAKTFRPSLRGVDLVGERTLAALGEDLDKRAVDADVQIQAPVAQRRRRRVHAREVGQLGSGGTRLGAVDVQQAGGDVVADHG